uniref:Uncharacterized protein n=1 Tax=Cannabis sativa TaxID=3483 RepID=A0A803Q6B0_CANSA
MEPATPTSRLFVSSSSAKGDLIEEPSRCSLLLYSLCNWADLYSTTLVGFDHTGRGRVYKRKYEVSKMMDNIGLKHLEAGEAYMKHIPDI